MKITVLGGKESGVGAAILAQQLGFAVWVSEFGVIPDKYKAEMNAHGIAFEEGGHTEEKVLDADLVVKSPGIPEKAPIIKAIRAKGIEIASEIEFASRHTDSTIVAITGSNGKTTTTLLIHHMLVKAGLDAGCAGNVGDSFARMVALDPKPYYVLEVSSFQLDDIRTFKPHIAVLTNITPDHLDRYNYELRNYADAKFRVAENQTAADHFIWCMDDPISAEILPQKNIKAQVHGFSYDKLPGTVAWVENNTIRLEMQLDHSTFSIDAMTIQGRHNVYNTMAAAVVGSVLELRKDKIRDAFSDFRNAEHRLEKVAVVRGVEFINDSKATNVNSTWYALESVDRPVIWIAGGVDKGNDYASLIPLVEKKVKCIIALGNDVLKIHKAFSQKVDMIVNTNSMEECVKMAYHMSNKGDCVLLSPACASFDLFEDYQDRGRQFKNAVKEL
ncbi:MAG: UDP-N-acetylmuramoyl-L-alanine--D-glutamate ligase [Bacteroidetes bacterium]|nr:UDP-N-acetylmuramoyl-L-alanine--D-glutamate ligase [Bacteroidota bacterium]